MLQALALARRNTKKQGGETETNGTTTDTMRTDNAQNNKHPEIKQELVNFILEILRLQDEYDCYGEPIYWATHGEYAPVTFFVLCNDLFWWATADAEKLMSEDIPTLRQAILDVQATGIYELCLDNYETGCALWCARKRGMRPQQYAYPQDTRIKTLFDACGPARIPDEQG